MSTPHELVWLYKNETGDYPNHFVEKEFTLWRSRGQWVVEITDEEKFKIWGNQGVIEIIAPDQDYIDWLENKVMEGIRNGK